MPQPLLDEANVGVVLERVGRGRRAQRVQTETLDLDLCSLRVGLQHLVDPVAGHRALEVAGAVIAGGAEEGALSVFAVPGQAQIGVDRLGCSRVGWHKARLRALAGDAEMQDAPALLQAPDLEGGELCAPKRVEQVRRQDRPVPNGFQAASLRCLQQLLGLSIRECRRLALV